MVEKKKPLTPSERGRANLRPPWKKGQTGNPAGGKKQDPELKALKNLTKKELVDVGNLVIKNDLEALKKLARTPGTPVLTVWLAAVCIRGISKGDVSSLDVLLNRLIGKVKDEVTLTSNLPQVTVQLPSNGREAKDDDDQPKSTVPAV